MTDVVDTSNPLASGLIFLAPSKSDSVYPYTDPAGSRVVSLTSPAAMTLSAPGPALSLGLGKATTTSSPTLMYPFTMMTFYYQGVNPGQAVSLMSVGSANNDEHMLWIDATFNVNARSRNSGGGADATLTATAAGYGLTTWVCLGGIWTSAASRQVYGGGTGTLSTANTTSVTLSGSDTGLSLGSDPSTSGNTATGYVKWSAMWNRVLTLTEMNSFAANPAQLLLTPAALSGNITLDDIVASGSFASSASAISGNITLDNIVAAGSLGVPPATIVSAPYKSWAGSLLASTTIPKVSFLRVSDMGQVLTLTSQTTDSSGVLTIANGAFSSGTKYLMVSCDATGAAFGAEVYTAA